LEHSYQIDLAGIGEPLVHPYFAGILAYLRSTVDSRANISLTTNGSHLRKWADELLSSNVTQISTSIHAATPETHNRLVGLGPDAFDNIVNAVRYVVDKKKENPRIWTSVVFIVMKQNIEELPRFIEIFNEVGVDQIFVRSLAPRDGPVPGLNYHTLPPYLHPNFEDLRSRAESAIRRSRVPVVAEPRTWSEPIFPKDVEAQIMESRPKSYKERMAEAATVYSRDTLPDPLTVGEPDESQIQAAASEPLDNPYNRSHPYYCPSPYTAFYINRAGPHEVRPCCYIKNVPGFNAIHLAQSIDFFQVWNCPAMVELRRCLFEGPLMVPCLKCPYYW
jgi:hypothetical protein